jgi:hypothetical protein
MYVHLKDVGCESVDRTSDQPRAVGNTVMNLLVPYSFLGLNSCSLFNKGPSFMKRFKCSHPPEVQNLNESL